MFRASQALRIVSVIGLIYLAHRLVPGGSGEAAAGTSPTALPKFLQYVLEEQTAAGTLREPLGLALTPDGSVIVADTENHRVQRFAADGSFVTMWGRHGSGEGQFALPRAVAVGPAGAAGSPAVYVLDGLSRVQWFSMSGRYLGMLSAPPQVEDDRPARVEGLAVADDGALYLSFADRLIRVAPSGTLDWSLQPMAAGKEVSSLGPPAVLPDGRIVVCDRTAARIIFVSPSGKQLTDWGRNRPVQGRRSASDPAGELWNPLKVLPDLNSPGRLWVWEPASMRFEWPALGRVHRFQDDGTWIDTQKLQDLRNARDLAVEANGGLRALVDRELLFAEADGSIIGRSGAGASVVLEQPIRVRQAPDGSIYLVQRQRVRSEPNGMQTPRFGLAGGVVHLDADGRRLANLAVPPDSRDGFEYPSAIAFEPDGDVLTALRPNNVQDSFISRHKPNGQWVANVQLLAADAPGVVIPLDIAVGPRGDRFVADMGTNSMVAFDSEWRYQRTLRHPYLLGPNPSFQSSWFPTAAAFGSTDDIFVSNLEDQSGGSAAAGFRSISRFRLDGTLIHRFAAEGRGIGNILDAPDIGSGPGGSLVVTDRGNGRLQLFDQDGRWLDHLEPGFGPQGIDGRPLTSSWGADERFYVGSDVPSVQVYGTRPSDAWRLETFDNPWLTGWPAQVSHLAEARVDWGEASPAAGLPKDGTSALLSRNLWLPKGLYQLRLQASGGARLWLGDRLVQDSWDQATSTWEYRLDLSGPLFARLAFRDLAGPAAFDLDIDPIQLLPEDPTAQATSLPPVTATPSAQPSITLAPAARYLSAYLPLVGRYFSRGGADAGPPDPILPSPTPTATPAWLASADTGIPAYALHPEIDVESYDVRLDIPHLGDPIRASLVVTLTARQALTAIDLDAEPDTVHVSKVSSGGQQLLHRFVAGRTRNNLISGAGLRIHLPHALQAGDRAVLHIDYAITYPVVTDTQPGQGFSMFSWYYGSPFLETLGWPYRTRFWLPSNDHPGDPATIKLELHVPPGLIAASVGRLVEGDYRQGSGLDAQGLQVFRWSLDQPVPTYGYNVVVGDLDIVHEDICYDIETINSERLPCDRAGQRVPLVYFVPRAELLQDDTYKANHEEGIKAFIVLSSMFGPYPFAKLGIADQPHPFSMEYPSLIAEAGPFISVHEVAHSWWGDGVQIKSWGDFWISEGITSYVSSLAMEVLTGQPTDYSSREGRLVQDANWDPYSGNSSPAYSKGAAAIGDLRTRIAALAGLSEADPKARDLFIAVMRGVYQEFRLKSLGSLQLFAFLKERLGPILAENGHPVPAAAVEAEIDAWVLSWTSYQTIQLVAESGDKRGAVDVLMAPNGPPIPAEATPLVPLAWYGLACGNAPPVQPVKGKIALIERGQCTFDEKVYHAANEGAVGIVYFTDDRAKIVPSDTQGFSGMRGIIDREPGLQLRDRLLEGAAVDVTFRTMTFDVRGNPLP